jgi:hypothetical protein
MRLFSFMDLLMRSGEDQAESVSTRGANKPQRLQLVLEIVPQAGNSVKKNTRCGKAN